MAWLGSLALALSFVLSVTAGAAGLLGARRGSQPLYEHARRAVWATAFLVTLAAMALLYSLVSHDFQVRYVFQHSSTHLPLIYTISAFWAGQEGSLLLWFWLLSLLVVLAIREQSAPEVLRPYLLSVLAFTLSFFAFMLVATSNPFQLLAGRPAEGVGMLPLLENPGMVVHPPILFLGYAGYTVPFAFALAALLSGNLDKQWLKAVRLWNLLAWLALSIGILIGAWWSYVELGWGGYWAWDPVENASLIPWLIGTAFLHSTMVQERRGMHKLWNVLLPTLAFVLCLFATLVTRGGIIVSDLHGFASSLQPIAYFLLAFIALALLTSLALSYLRRPALRDEREVQSFFSRESSFLLTNLFFCGAAALVFLGTIFPALTQALQGRMVSLTGSFYNRAIGPLMALVVCLMGICPVLRWEGQDKGLRRFLAPALGALLAIVTAFVLGVRQLFPLLSTAICSFVVLSLLGILFRDLASRHRATGENTVQALLRLLAKSHRRYGAYLVHLAIVFIAIGITGSSAYKREYLISMRPGQATQLHGYTIRYEDRTVEMLNAEPVTYQSRIRYATALGIYRGERKVSTLVAEKNHHWALPNPWVTEVAIHSNLKEDLYIILASLDNAGLASFQIVINPLVNWIWLGGG
ncbi:MAG: heme lyase CcmF/NrfE family subunit, partial [Chloroflexi bacterium]|nr:heme lyase CcmF/NrfE family subunit [Chloroflexota bacterium]